MERHTETISPPVNGKKLPPPPDEPAISPEATDIPPPPDEELDVLIERQSRQKGLYPEQGYEGMAKPQPRQKIVHESIKEYLPRLKEVFPKVKDKNKFIEQLFAGHEFKEGGMNELKDALDETIDFKLPREYNSYESKRAREKSFYDVTKKTDELGFSGRDFEDKGKAAIVEGFIQSNQYNLTDKEKMALRADVLEHIKQKPIETEAKRRADAIFKQKYGKSPEQVFNTEEIIKGEQTKVVDETRLWVKSENDKLRNYSYTEISNIRGDIENQIASYREQLESQVQSGQLQESDAFNLFNDFQVKKNTEYQQALKNVQSRYIQRFEQIRKNAESKASSRFAERLKDVDEDVRQKAKDYNAIFSEEYSKFSNYVANIRKQMYRSMPLSYIIGSKFHSGIFTTLATTGAALTMAGAENAGDNLTQMANDNLRKLDLPQVTRENIADPVFWAATISESMPFTIATMLPAFATGGLTAIGTAAALRGAGMGALRAATASQIAATATAGITGWYLEKKLEAGGAYLDALQRGESESEAIEKADFVDRWNNANIVMSIAEMMPAFKIGKATKFKGLRRITESVPFGMSMEGIQEFYQGYGQAKAIDSELSLGEYAKTEDAFVSTVSGTIMGAGFGIYGNLSEKGGSVKTRVISRLVDEGKPVTAAIETAVLNQAVTDEEAKMLADIASLSASARERFDDIDDPAMRVAAITLHSEIGQLQSKLKGDATDDAINKVISEKQKQLSEVISGTAKVIGITIGEGSPLVATESELMDMAKDAEFADMFFKGDIKVDFKNTDNKQFLETVKQTYDSQNKTGVQGSEQIGQELVKGQPDQSAGAEKAEAGGVLQTQEGLSSSQGADKAVLEQPSSDTELKKSKAVSVIDNSDFSKEEKESAKEKVSKAKNPVVLFRGKGGKKNIKGEPLNVHPDVKGVFYYEDEQAARHFSRGEGVDMVVVDGTTETVEAPPDTPISKLREVETELINNSKADIVYLKTLDLRGRETQVIVKNPKALVSLDSGEKATLKEGEAALGEKTETEKAEESEKKQVSGVEGKEEMGDMGEKSAADEVTDVAKETPQKEEVVKRESKPEESGLLKEGSLKGYRTAPIKEITTDESRFQGREELDEENVNRIVKEYDERKFDPIVVWKDPNTNRYVVLSGHHRFEAAKRLRLESIPIKEFTGTEQEAIDFAKDSNVLGKQETPIERANRYRKMREDGVSESEIQERARSAHGKDATFILNLSRLHPKGKAISAIRQFDKSTDKSTRSMIEAIADWIGAVKKKYPELSVVQENEMFDYLMLSYSTKNQRGKISTRNQFVDVASAVIERAKYRGNYNEDTFLNFGNVAGKGSLEIEYDGRLEEAKRIESEARKNLDLKRAELISRGATGSQLDKALLPYENALRAAIKDVSEIRASKEAVLRGDMAQINLFEELEQLKHITDENTEREIERIIDEGASKTKETSGDNKQAEKPETGTKGQPVNVESASKTTDNLEQVENTKKDQNENAADFGKVISASSRFRPKELVVFDKPIVGKNGNKLISYEWAYQWVSLPDREWELKNRRVSDWSQAETSAETGRDIVHKFTIERKDGVIVTVSSESVPYLLGYLDAKEMKRFPSIVSSVKTLAKQRMQLALLKAQEAEYNNIKKEVEKMERPKIREALHEELPFVTRKMIESGRMNPNSFTHFKMGDEVYRQEGGGKTPNKETIEQLTIAWIKNEIEKRGGKYPSGIHDLERRIERQEKKVEQAIGSKLEIKSVNELKDKGGKSALYQMADSEGQFAPISEKQFDSLLSKLNKAFGGKVKILTDEEFDKAIGDPTLRVRKTVFGAMLPDGSIYIDRSKLNANSPIHEYTHLFNSIIQKTNPKLWNAIVEAVKKTKEWDDVKADPNYANLKTDNEIADEAFARIVGNLGEGTWEQYGNKTIYRRIAELIKQFYNAVLSAFGVDVFKGMSAEGLAKLTLNELMGGQTVSPFVLSNEQLAAEESLARQQGFKNLTHKINTIRKVNGITDERRYIQEFTKEEIEKALNAESVVSDKPIEERLREAREELREAWGRLNNKGFMYNPKAEAEKHVALDKALLKFAVLCIKKHAGDLVKATQYAFNQLKRITGVKDIKQLDVLMADAMTEYASLPSDKKDLVTVQEKEKLKSFINGIVTGIKQGKKTHKEAQKEIREYIKTNLDGKFSLSAIRKLTHAVGMITDDASFQAQIRVIDNLINTAMYSQLVDDVIKAKSKLKRQAKPQLADRIRAINPFALDRHELIQLKQAIDAMNMKVPSYAFAESIIANLEAKNQAYQNQFTQKEKTIEDIQKALDNLNKDINNVDDYRNFLNALRSFIRTADALLRIGKITNDEYDAFMQSVFDSDNNLLSHLHDKINTFREELADDILSTDISGYTPTKAEEPFFKELESLRKEHLLKLSPLTLSMMLEVKERIAAEGFTPMEQLADVIIKALSEMGSKKLTKQFESTTLKDKGIEYLKMLLSSKEKTFWTRILGVKGTELYDTILNPVFRAIEQRKRIADAIFSDMFKRLDEAGFMGLPGRKKTKSKYKIAMFFHYMGERGLRGVKDKKTKVAPDRVGYRDIFGGLTGNQKEREDYTEAQKIRADEQWSKYTPYQREIIKEIYDEFMERYGTPDGRIDLDKMEAEFESSLNEQEKALYQIHKDVTAQLEDYQRVANAITKREFNPVEGYIMRDYIDTEFGIKDDFSFATAGLNRVVIESTTGKERTTNDPMAVNLDLKELLIKGIQRTSLHYSLSFANYVAHNTINKSGIRSDIKSALRASLKDMILFEYYFSNTNKIITNITNSAAYLSLVSIPRTIAEAVVTPISSLLILSGSKGGGISIITQYNRRKTMKLMEETNSTLLDKLKLKGEKNFELKGSREFEKIGKLRRIGHAAVSISESIAMPAWYALFRSEFKSLTGLDYNKITDHSKYWQEVKQAASYADMEMKQITGGGIKAEGRERIQVFFKPVISEKRLSVLGREFKIGNISLSVRRDTPIGKMFGFLQEYPFRDSERLLGSVRNIGNAPVGESMRIIGTIINMLGYGMAAAFTRLLWQWIFASASGDDERKDEIESALQEMVQPKYYVENAIGAMVQTAGIRMSGAGRAANIILASVLYNFSEDEEQKNMIADFVEREYYSPVVGGQYSRFVKSELTEKTRKIQSTTDFIVNLNPVIRFVSDMAGQFVDRHGGITAASEAIDEIIWKIENGHEVDPLDAEFIILYNNLINVTNTVLTGRGVQIPETRTIKRELKNIIKNSEFIESIEK